MEDFIDSLVDSPEDASELIGGMLSKYKPVVYAILDGVFDVYKDLNLKDEYFSQRAAAKRRLLDAYLNAGFTRDEAMALLLNAGSLGANLVKTLSSSASRRV